MPFSVNGYTVPYWDKVGIETYIGPLNGAEALLTKFAIGVSGNSNWKYGTNSSQTVPTNEWCTLRYAWNFDEATHKINTAIWINGTLVAEDPDLTPGAYPGITATDNNAWWLNKIDLSGFLGEYGEVEIYNEFIVPEPATMILLGIGGMVLSQRRKRV